MKIMLEWAREVMHRLLQDQNTSLETGKNLTADGQGRTRGGFDRFLQEFQANNELEANNGESLHQRPDSERAA